MTAPDDERAYSGAPDGGRIGRQGPREAPKVYDAQTLQLLERIRCGRLRRLPGGYFDHPLMHDDDDAQAPSTRMSFHAAAERGLATGEPKHSPVASGYAELDRALGGGFVPGRLYVLTGLAGMGKTALAAAIAFSVAKAGLPVLVLSLKLAAPALARRMVEGIVGVEVDRPGGQAAAAREQLHSALHDIGNIPLTIDDAPIFTAWDAVQRIADGGERKLVVLDGIDFMLGHVDPEARDAELWELLAALGSMARPVGMPLLATHRLPQPARLHGKDADPWPHREDVGGAVLATADVGGAVLATADVVLALHRPAYFHGETEPDNEAFVRVVQNRWGRTETASLRFQRPAWFANLGRQGDGLAEAASPSNPGPSPGGY